MNEQFMRQAGLVPYDLISKANITLVGAGGIGSVAASYLLKMGVKNLTVYDFDNVEIHNIPNQMYPIGSVGKPKVEALKDHLEYMEGVTINVVNDPFGPKSEMGDIVIAAVDSMEVRKMIWNTVSLSEDVNYFIDGRMGGWTCVRLACDMTSQEEIQYYESTLFDDSEAIDLPCTERAIIFNTGSIGSMIANTVAKYVQGFDIEKHVVYDIKCSRMFAME